MNDREPADLVCKQRTRSAVLNILVAVGLGIAVSGLLLRWRDRNALDRAPATARRAMLGMLLVLVVASVLCRRLVIRRSSRDDPAHRVSLYYRAHVVAATMGGLAVPLGLLYGWTVRPQIDAVAPFWVAALATGFLAMPRDVDLRANDAPSSVTLPQPSEPKR